MPLFVFAYTVLLIVFTSLILLLIIRTVMIYRDITFRASFTYIVMTLNKPNKMNLRFFFTVNAFSLMRFLHQEKAFTYVKLE